MCSPSQQHVAQVLAERFVRDERIDWKFELLRRKNALQVFQDEVKVSGSHCWHVPSHSINHAAVC